MTEPSYHSKSCDPIMKHHRPDKDGTNTTLWAAVAGRQTAI